jgi:hypothetical protein
MALTVIATALWLSADEAPPDEAPFRRDLRRGMNMVIRASREQFKPMRGARIDIRPGRETWFQANRDLPMATSCRVYEHPQKYTCIWERSPVRRDLAAFFRTLTVEVEAVLGDSWERSGGAAGQVRFREKDEGTGVLLAREAGAVRLTVTPGVRPRPAVEPQP